ncbi:MAG: hypothetical protein ACR2KU_12945 [Gammaproteobacteria bacterium]|nr:hypothetical protein [Gammaproteobacteria bacterium]
MKSSIGIGSPKLTRNLLFIAALAAAPVLAHGPAHDESLARPLNDGATGNQDFFPTHLLAPVCGLHEHHGAHGKHAAYARRLELAKLAQE